MPRQSKNPSVKNQSTNNAGQFTCPKCNGPMVPMFKGNGWRCAVEGNRFVSGRWTICDGVIWNNTRAAQITANKIERPSDFPTIKSPTDQQQAINNLLALSPKARGSRAVIINAGAGTAKTTTVAWATRSLFNRLGDLSNYALLAFNRNAANVLLSKLPSAVPDISTLNSWGGKCQGYNIKSYEKGKIRKIFKRFVDHIPYDNRPNMGNLQQVIDRARDLLLYDKSAQSPNWNTVIDATIQRFPGLGKSFAANEKTIREYLPVVAVTAITESNVIDLGEQTARPVMLAIAKLNWHCPLHLTERNAEFTDEDVQEIARLIRAVDIADCKGLVIDEAQDLSLCQIVLFLAMTWRKGELTIVGDDKHGNPNDDDYKAGQGIFGWRGAFAGSMKLIARLWTELTGETPIQQPLSVTFRCPPEIVNAVKPLNKTLTSAKPAGSGQAWQVHEEQAFHAWLQLPDNKTALWLTRTNAPLAGIFLETLKRHAAVTIRGGDSFEGQIDAALYPAIGYYDRITGEYKVTLDNAITALKKIQAEAEVENSEDSLESFIIGIAEAIKNDPQLLLQAKLPAVPTMGNVRKFILFYADKQANRVLSTVYRAKGDEADLTIVSDCDKFNQAWNNDEDESAAVRFVAATRASETLLVCGILTGVNVQMVPDDVDPAAFIPSKPEEKPSKRKK